MQTMKVLACLMIVFFNSIQANLLEDYSNWRMDQNPLSAYNLGFKSNEQGFINDYSEEGMIKRYQQAKQFYEKASKLMESSAAEQDDIRYAKMIQFETKMFIKSYEVKGYLLPPVASRNGVQLYLPHIFSSSNALRWNSDIDVENNLKLLQNIPQMLEQIQSLLQKGIDEKITFAEETMKNTINQFKEIQTDNAADSDFYQQFALSQTFKYEALKIIQLQTLPAFKNLQDFIEFEYMKHVRKGPGVVSMGHLRGEEYYQTCLEYYTTLANANATQFYTLGMAELKKSQNRFMQLAQQLGYANQSSSIEQAIKNMYGAKEMYFQSSEEILKQYQTELENIKPKLQSIFQKEILNDDVYSVQVNGIPKGRLGLAYYSKSAINGERKGAFYVNSHNLKSMTRDIVATITLHESSPGHHMQNAVLWASTGIH